MSDQDRNGPGRATRRGFLKAAGLSAASLAACQRLPVQHALPHLVPPEEIVPGVPVHYAGTCTACNAGCGLMSKVLDGRPVKLEGDPEHPLSRGGLCAIGQGQLRELYDPGRLRGPLLAGRETSWTRLDEEVRSRLRGQLVAAPGPDGSEPASVADGDSGPAEPGVWVVSRTIVSPSARTAVARFLNATGGRLVEHDLDPQAPSAVREAYERLVGRPLTPGLDLERADVLVSLAADPLASGPDPVVQAAAWAARRKVAEERGAPYHLQVESSLSGTGAAADERWHATPGERERLAFALLRSVAEATGGAEANDVLEALGPVAEDASLPHADELPRIVAELLSHRGRSLILSGSNRLPEQLAVAVANRLLGNEGSTVRLDRESLVSRGLDRDLLAFRQALFAGRVRAAFFVGLDPVGGLADGERIAEALAEVPLTVGVYRRANATSRACRAVVAVHHELESWSDAEPRPGAVTLGQPSVRPLFDTRHRWESFLRWSGAPVTDWLAYLRVRWQGATPEDLAPRPLPEEASTEPVPAPGPLDAAWNEIVRTAGRADPEAVAAAARTLPPVGSGALADGLDALREAAAEASSRAGRSPGDPGNGDGDAVEVELVTEVSARAGQHAANPWLRELPDPLTRASWAPCVRMAPERATALDIGDGDEVEITAGETSLVLPVRILVGQHPDVLAVPLGYGDGTEEPDCDARGDLAASLRVLDAAGLHHDGIAATVTATGGRASLPLMQVEDRPHGRPIVHQVAEPDGEVHEPHHPEASLWPEREHSSPHWEMVIDLDACTGCSGCVVACQAENNIPVVGAALMHQHRDMHWLRIDRYVTGDGEQPDVVFEPMLCCQCDDAPCETVCPVLATVHSEDGLNQQVYNRCVGTRYCANNCPYKVRRFNWFDFQPEDPVERLVLNPDVVVRSRGVMEKCTFCVQRIQAARIEGRREGTAPEVTTACQQSCPTDAIRFGDGADPTTPVSRLKDRGRSFQILAELGVQPSITYMARVRNRPGFEVHDEEGGEDAAGHEPAGGEQEPEVPSGEPDAAGADVHGGAR